MNPEFRRNVWLELTPRRIVFMVVVLALIFFAAAISGGSDWRPDSVALFLYYFIVVFWGSRNAALSVVGEIRDRTWDMQRLSSLSAGAMTWGKLFGSTIYNWFGGTICLAVLLASRLVHQGTLATAIDLVYFVVVGVISQSTSLLASLIAARRRQSHTRLEVFAYQVTGIVAAICVFAVWQAADPASSFLPQRKAVDIIAWWGQRLDARPFLLASLAVFAGWILVACYRLMRIELKMRNGPFVWLGFLVFAGVYVAGFEPLFPQGFSFPHITEVVGLGRLSLAAGTFSTLSYVMVLLEPKDRVLYRWMGGELSRGHIAQAALRLQAWMMSYFFALVAIIGVILYLKDLEHGVGHLTVMAIAGFGFITRDIGIFVLMAVRGRRRGDLAAIVILFALYALIPAILVGLDIKRVLPIFIPLPGETLWLGPAGAWAQAVLVAVLATLRLARDQNIVEEPAHV